MSVDSAFQRFRDANPVPKPEALKEEPQNTAHLLAVIQEESTEMLTRESITVETKSKQPRDKWMIALAAAAAIILIGLLALIRLEDGPEVTTPPRTIPEGTTLAVLQEQGQFDIFVDLITRNSFITERLAQSDSNTTVLAPNDDVFEALPPGTLEALLAEENRRELWDFLLRHTVPGEYRRDDFFTGQNLFTSSAPMRSSRVSVENGTVTIQGQSNMGVAMNRVTVLQFDIDTSNGVIHVVDGLLIPGDFGSEG